MFGSNVYAVDIMFAEGPANTALLTAAARAMENEQDHPLVADPYAADLAGEEGKRLLEKYGIEFTLLETIRTKFFDDAVLDSARRGVRQFIILGSGLDTRPYRLKLPSDALWLEIDFGSVLEYKRRILKDKTPSVMPIDVPMDVTLLDASRDLAPRKFDPKTQSAWLADGLLPYLTDQQVEQLLDTIAGASAPGSELLTTCPSKKMMQMNSRGSSNYNFLAELGVSYVFSGNDRPDELLKRHGYKAEVVFVGHRKAHYGMLPHPPFDSVPNEIPVEWLVKGVKQSDH